MLYKVVQVVRQRRIKTTKSEEKSVSLTENAYSEYWDDLGSFLL